MKTKAHVETYDKNLIFHLLEEYSKHPEESIKLVVGKMSIPLRYEKLNQQIESFSHKEGREIYYHHGKIECDLILGKE